MRPMRQLLRCPRPARSLATAVKTSGFGKAWARPGLRRPRAGLASTPDLQRNAFQRTTSGSPQERMTLLRDQIEAATTQLHRRDLVNLVQAAKDLCTEYVQKGLPVADWTLEEDHYYALLSAHTHSAYPPGTAREALDSCVAVLEIMELAGVPVPIAMHEDMLRFAVTLHMKGFYHLEQQARLLMDPNVTRDNVAPPDRDAVAHVHGMGDSRMVWQYRGGVPPDHIWSEELVNLFLLNACMTNSRFLARMRLFLDVCMANGYRLWEETLEAIVTAYTAGHWMPGQPVHASGTATRLLYYTQVWGYELRREVLMRVVDACIYEQNNFHLSALLPWAKAQGFDVERGALSASLQLAASAADMRLAAWVWEALRKHGFRRTQAEHEAMLHLFTKRSNLLQSLTSMVRMCEADFPVRRRVWQELTVKEGQSVPRVDFTYYSLAELHNRGLPVPLAALSSIVEASAHLGYEDGVVGTLQAVEEEFGLEPDTHTYNAVLRTCVAKADGGWELSHGVLNDMAARDLAPDAETLHILLMVLKESHSDALALPELCADPKRSGLWPKGQAAARIVEVFRNTLDVKPTSRTLRNLAIFGAQAEPPDLEVVAFARRGMLELGFGEPEFFRVRLADLLQRRGADVAQLGLAD